MATVTAFTAGTITEAVSVADLLGAFTAAAVLLEQVPVEAVLLVVDSVVAPPEGVPVEVVFLLVVPGEGIANPAC